MEKHGDGEVPKVVRAYGEPDDHLRLTVLIADALEPFEPDAAVVCKTAEKNPWTARVDALRGLLRATELKRSATTAALCVRDAHALPDDEPRGGARWDDRSFARERAQLLTVLQRAEDDGLVTLQGSGARPDADDLAERFDDDLRPLARWLKTEGHVDESSLREYLRLGRPQHVLTVMWDVIEGDAREAALRLSAFRAPQRLNGVFGPLPLRATAVDSTGLGSVSRPAVDQLLAMGLLRPTPGTSRDVEFPRLVREFLRAFATAYAPEELQRDHKTIATALQGEATETVIERHHHAVLARDVDLARSTARYYGADLRVIARDASLRRDFPTAVQLYEEIVSRFDPKDAYAWEYLGYNLWQPYRRAPQQMSAMLRERVRTALLNACSDDSVNTQNPLFLGRLLGFRACVGEDISTDFASAVSSFRSDLPRAASDQQTRLSWLATQVHSALDRAGRAQEYERLCRPWTDEEQVYRILTQPYAPGA